MNKLEKKIVKKNEDDIAIDISNVSKSFRLPHEKNSSIKSLFLNPFKKRTYEKQEVLKNTSFKIEKGDFFGIVGRNGSGKSTLLKLLAGIYTPDKGSIKINGKLTPFIELGVGFNPELTGRENIFLNGALLGFNRKEMMGFYDEIVEFAELEKFMDQKLKNYSSGMQVRLAFSIAIRANTDILVLDEVLAVGDARFQKKCFDYFLKLKKDKKTVVLVTHDMGAIERFCNKAIIIDNNYISDVLDPGAASIEYQRINSEGPESDGENSKDEGKNKKDYIRWGTGRARITSLKIKNKNKCETGTDLQIEISTATQVKGGLGVVIGLAFIDQFGVNISGPNSMGIPFSAGETAVYTVANLPLAPGSYKIVAALFDEEANEELDHIENKFKFDVYSKNTVHGKIEMRGTWKKR